MWQIGVGRGMRSERPRLITLWVGILTILPMNRSVSYVRGGVRGTGRYWILMQYNEQAIEALQREYDRRPRVEG